MLKSKLNQIWNDLNPDSNNVQRLMVEYGLRLFHPTLAAIPCPTRQIADFVCFTHTLLPTDINKD